VLTINSVCTCTGDGVGPERREIWTKWDQQIRLFAKYFLRHANLPTTKQFTLLDAGCGIGSALHEIHNIYPNAILYGCDNDPDHYNECLRVHSHDATFILGDIRTMTDAYNVVYVSNVLEHLHSWKVVVLHLLEHCERLYIMVPFQETLNGQTVSLEMNHEHLTFFDKESFNFLRSDQISIEYRVIRTPYAWGHPFRRELYLRTKAFLNNKPFDLQRELLVAITNRNEIDNLLPKQPFHSRLNVIKSCMYIK